MSKSKLAGAVIAALVFGHAYAHADDALKASTAPQQGTSSSQDSSQDQTPQESKAKNLQTVTVTGSRIRGVEIATAQPIVTITQADIQKTGLMNVGDILQNLTVAGQPDFTKASVLVSNAEQGGQYIDLYGIGANRSLVLVNGKRWVTSLAGYTDLSTIPAALIERIDVLKDGASPIYGSDAIGGVVNIILKDHYNGAEFNGQIGQNQGGDGSQQSYTVTFGNSTDKSSIVFSATSTKTSTVWAKSRDFTSYNYGPYQAQNALSSTGPWGRYYDESAGEWMYINHTGGDLGNGIGVSESPTAGNFHAGPTLSDTFNYASQMMQEMPTQLQSFFTHGSYNLSDSVEFTATAMYADRKSRTTIAGYPFTTTNYPDAYLSADSYYNPTGEDLQVARRFIELPRTTRNEAKSTYFNAGFDGEFNVGEHLWNWDAGFTYAKYDVTLQTSGNLNIPHLAEALGPSFLNSQGVVQCGTAADPIALSECQPINIFASPNSYTSAQLAYINADETSVMADTSKEFSANITGGLFDMPLDAGTLSFAAGVSHRELSGYQDPDSLAALGETTDLVSGRTAGGYTTNEVYAELNVPVLRNLPGASELSFDLASRYSHYSNFGGTTNNKASFVYSPIEDLKFRGTYAKGFRAPTIEDLYGGGSQTFDTYTDPCDAKFGSLSNATVAKNCAAAGLSSTFRQTDVAGKPVTASGTQSASPFWTNSGNPALKPETSVTRTLGLVYSPHYVPGLDFTLDWYKIRIDNLISGVGADYTLNQCYQYSVQTFCNMFTRDANGQVTNLKEGTTNLGWLSTSGYNLGIRYRLPTFSFGQLVVSLDANYVDDYTQRSAPGAQKINYAGQWGNAHWRANTAVDWSYGNWGVTWDMRYYGSSLDQCWDDSWHCNEPDYTSKNWGYGTGAYRIGVVVMHDIQGRYKLPWNADVAVGIRDMFDKHPPIVLNATVDGYSSASSVDPTLDLGRYFYLQYNQKF